ncbi:MAG: hypothetical protein ACK41E_06900 [Deinococcales bacterium]
MYELLLLLKSGREIVVGRAGNQQEAQQLVEGVSRMYAGIKVASEQHHALIMNFEGAVYWVVPTEIEGFSLYRTDENAPPLVMQPQQEEGAAR